jgi:hypothetical protein
VNDGATLGNGFGLAQHFACDGRGITFAQNKYRSRNTTGLPSDQAK